MRPSRCLREAFTQWARRGAFAKGSPRLHERFVNTSRALKASPTPTEASWSLLEGFARRSWRLHLETIRRIMTSPREFGPAFSDSQQYQLLLLLIHTFSVLSLQATEETMVTQQVSHRPIKCPCLLARGQKEVRRSTGHIMVTTRHSNQQRSKSRQNPCQV